MIFEPGHIVKSDFNGNICKVVPLNSPLLFNNDEYSEEYIDTDIANNGSWTYYGAFEFKDFTPPHSKKTTPKTIFLQDYEIENILNALKDLEHTKRGSWELQDNNQYYYSETKESKRIKFTINNIKRQLESN